MIRAASENRSGCSEDHALFRPFDAARQPVSQRLHRLADRRLPLRSDGGKSRSHEPAHMPGRLTQKSLDRGGTFGARVQQQDRMVESNLELSAGPDRGVL